MFNFKPDSKQKTVTASHVFFIFMYPNMWISFTFKLHIPNTSFAFGTKVSIANFHLESFITIFQS